MNVRFGVLRQRIVDYVGQVVDVDPARRHVGSHQNIGQLFLELAEDFLPLSLRNVAVQPLGRVPSFGQPVHQLVDAHLGAAENDAVKLGFRVDDARQRVELVAVAHFEINLVGQLGRHLLRGDPEQFAVAHVLFRQRDDPFGHRGRKEQNASPVVRMGEDFFDILDEAHVQHFVGLVEDQVLEFPDVKRSPVQVVEYPARRSDDHVDALGQSAELLAHRSAAVDGRDRQLAAAVQRQQFFGHLQRQLARRNKDQGLSRALERTEPFENRQAERGGLAGPGLGLRDDVVRLFGVEQRGNRQPLYGRRGLEAFRANRLERPVGQPEGAEFFCLSHV